MCQEGMGAVVLLSGAQVQVRVGVEGYNDGV